jgi:hypothetical protein
MPSARSSYSQTRHSFHHARARLAERYGQHWADSFRLVKRLIEDKIYYGESEMVCLDKPPKTCEYVTINDYPIFAIYNHDLRTIATILPNDSLRFRGFKRWHRRNRR